MKKLIIINPNCQIIFNLNTIEMWIFRRIFKQKRYKIKKSDFKLRGQEFNTCIVDEAANYGKNR